MSFSSSIFTLRSSRDIQAIIWCYENKIVLLSDSNSSDNLVEKVSHISKGGMQTILIYSPMFPKWSLWQMRLWSEWKRAQVWSLGTSGLTTTSDIFLKYWWLSMLYSYIISVNNLKESEQFAFVVVKLTIMCVTIKKIQHVGNRSFFPPPWTQNRHFAEA